MRVNNNSVNILRAFGALYIVGFWHLMNYFNIFPGYSNKITYGITILALATFTALSGFLLGLRPIDLSMNDFKEFYRRRFLRIYPPLVFSVILLAAVKFISPKIALKTVLLLGVVIPPAPSTIWYVSMLVLFYVAAPVMIIFARRYEILKYTSVIFSLILIMYIIEFNFNIIDSRVILYFPCFAAGIFLAKMDFMNMNIRVYYILFGLSVIGYFICLLFPERTWETSVLSAPFALSSSMFVILSVMNLKLPEVEIKWLSLIGEASLFMYLLHRFFYKIFNYVFSFKDQYIKLIAFYVIALPLVIILSWLCQKAYDGMMSMWLGGRRRVPSS